MLELLPALAGGTRPQLVVDLGSGTGLSTRFWAEHADGGRRRRAERRDARLGGDGDSLGERSLRRRLFLRNRARTTGLADIVTCSQSLQWMEPEPTFAEIARILRPGGVFAAYQYEKLQTPYWEPEAAWGECAPAIGAAAASGSASARSGPRWPVSASSGSRSPADSGTAASCNLHSVEEGDAERLVGFALSEGARRRCSRAGTASPSWASTGCATSPPNGCPVLHRGGSATG